MASLYYLLLINSLPLVRRYKARNFRSSRLSSERPDLSSNVLLEASLGAAF